MAVPILGAIIKFVGKVLGLAKKFNLAGKIQDLILKAEAFRKMSGHEKYDYVLKTLMNNSQVKNYLAKLKKEAIKAGYDANAIYNDAYDKIKAQIEANVQALNALGQLLPHQTRPNAGTPYAALYSAKDIERLVGSTG